MSLIFQDLASISLLLYHGTIWGQPMDSVLVCGHLFPLSSCASRFLPRVINEPLIICASDFVHCDSNEHRNSLRAALSDDWTFIYTFVWHLKYDVCLAWIQCGVKRSRLIKRGWWRRLLTCWTINIGHAIQANTATTEKPKDDWTHCFDLVALQLPWTHALSMVQNGYLSVELQTLGSCWDKLLLSDRLDYDSWPNSSTESRNA